MESLLLLVSNLHCPSCVSHIEDILSQLPGVYFTAEVSLISQTIRIKFDSDLVQHQSIIRALSDGAFDIRHVTHLDTRGNPLQDYEIIDDDQIGSEPQRQKAQQKHIETCHACQEKTEYGDKASKDDTVIVEEVSDSIDKSAVITIDGTLEDDASRTYIVSVAIEGMTCGSCVGTITTHLEELSFVSKVSIDLLNNSGIVEFHWKDNLDRLMNAFDDLGYSATLVNLSEAKSKTVFSDSYTVSLAVEGMTCGSCVGTITQALQSLSFVSKVNVDLIGNSASVEFTDKGNLDKILEQLDDLGYPATVVGTASLDSQDANPSERVVELQIEGMHCQHCPERVLTTLNALVLSGDISEKDFKVSRPLSLQNPRVQVTYNPYASKSLNIRQFISMINSVDPSFTVSVYHAPTMEERSKRLQHKERMAILRRVIFTGIISVPSLIIGVIYMALVPADNPSRVWFEQPIWSGNATRIEWALFIMTTPVMFFGADLFHRRAFKEIWGIWKPRSTVPILRRFYRFGSMNMLISIGTLVAYCSSLAVLIVNAVDTNMDHHGRMSHTYFDVITFLTFFILIGKYLEAYSKVQAGDAVSMLSQLRPSETMLVENGDMRKIPVDQLEIGDVVQIPRGHSPPADGIVEQDGSFSFDESSLTGESKPVRKRSGDVVYTGTINVADPVLVKVTDVGGSSMLDQIIDVVRSGQAKRAPIERFADILTGYFVPVVTLVAILTWLIWLGLGLSGRLPDAWLDSKQGGWAFWSLEFAIAVFVIACPCGIGLAAPTALFVGGGLAAKQGILVQGGGQAFQEASRLDAIVFDKTGTLTQGQMQVTQFISLTEEHSKDQIFAMSKAMESLSSHPIAQAIAAYCGPSSEEAKISEVREIPGQGMVAKVAFGQDSSSKTLEVAIGNEILLKELNKRTQSISVNGTKKQIETTIQEDLQSVPTNVYLGQQLHQLQSQGHSIAIVAISQTAAFEPVAVFGLSDPLRPEAVEVVSSLRALNLSIHLCTGDNAITARAIASQLDIPATNVRAGVSPQGKADYIREIQNPVEGGRKLVAFVGDGVNDTAALTAADVSISLSSGSDIAMNASSFILLNSHLSTIQTLVTLSKRVFRRVKINFFWAAIYNVSLIPVAAGVFFAIGATEEKGGFRLSPVWAAVAMAGSSVSVVLSSLALKLPEMKWFPRR